MNPIESYKNYFKLSLTKTTEDINKIKEKQRFIKNNFK